MWHSSANQLYAVGGPCRSSYQAPGALTFSFATRTPGIFFQRISQDLEGSSCLEGAKLGCSAASILFSLDISIIIHSEEMKSLSKQPKFLFLLNQSSLLVRISLSSLRTFLILEQTHLLYHVQISSPSSSFSSIHCIRCSDRPQ
jgi:hypothetical protein